MKGKEIRLTRLFSGGKPPVIVAVDHGQTMGPIRGLEDFPSAVSRLRRADGILMAPAMANHTGRLFHGRNAPCLITRLNWTTGLCITWDYKEAPTAEVITVSDALALGADVVLANLTLRTGREDVDAANVGIFARLVKQKEALGVPLIGEMYPLQGESIPRKELHTRVKEGVRIACELGADMIKTFYTGSSFHEVCEAVPIPVFALGAAKRPTEIAALQLARDAMAQGARGVVFGRNVLQAENPAAFLAALKDVVKYSSDPKDAAAKYGLE